MPLFTKKFEAKPIPSRSGRCNIGCPVVGENIDEYKSISLSLGSKELRFADGIWIHTTRKGDIDEVVRLHRRLKSLEEENNMCNLKMEIFLDLLAEQTSELNVLQSKDK